MMTDANRPDRPEGWYRDLVSHSTDIVSVIDEHGTIQYKSPAIEAQLGYDHCDLIGDHAFEYIHADDVERIEQAVRPVFEGDADRSEPWEYRFQHADGSWPWFESILTDCTATALEGYVVNSRNITDRKHQEKALRRERDRLDEFASVVSHDLRNPLNVAMTRLELAQTDEDEHLDAAARALDRMEALIQDLLTLSQEGDHVSAFEAVDLANTVESCWHTVKTAEATLGTETDQTIQADATRLQQLLENLLGNAIEHGGEDVTVTVGALDDDVGFYVADDGPGIPAEKHEQVFESGYTTSAEGTGFGLAIVEKIAEAHDWQISVTDSEDGGARFEITGLYTES